MAHYIVYITKPGAEMQVAEVPHDINDHMDNWRSKFVAAAAGIPHGTASLYSVPFANSAEEALQKATEAGFHHCDDVPPVTQRDMDENFHLLVQTKWFGTFTKQVRFSREGNEVFATFGDREDAVKFIHGYLGNKLLSHDIPAIRQRDTNDTENVRGLTDDNRLRRKSMADRIIMPEERKIGKPVTIRIPLDILDADGLRALIAREHAIGLRNDHS
jgi:hypothetical protein